MLAGDDTAAIGVVSGLQQADGAGAAIGVVWVDAHGDFNTPETSFSGILAGMPVAILAGLAGPLWREAAGLAAPVPTDRIVLAGTRELDDKESELLRSTDVRVLHAGDLHAEGRFSRRHRMARPSLRGALPARRSRRARSPVRPERLHAIGERSDDR